jgi:hypothetical protein
MHWYVHRAGFQRFVICRVKALESSDPTFMAAVREYKRHMAQKDNIAMEPLLLRINSALHVQKSLGLLMADTEKKYRDLLSKHCLPEQFHLEALEAVLLHDEVVCCCTTVSTISLLSTRTLEVTLLAIVGVNCNCCPTFVLPGSCLVQRKGC